MLGKTDPPNPPQNRLVDPLARALGHSMKNVQTDSASFATAYDQASTQLESVSSPNNTQTPKARADALNTPTTLSRAQDLNHLQVQTAQLLNSHRTVVLSDQDLQNVLPSDFGRLTIGSQNYIQVPTHNDVNSGLYALYGVPIQDPVNGFQLNTPTALSDSSTGTGEDRQTLLRQAVFEKVSNSLPMLSSETLTRYQVSGHEIDDFKDTKKPIDEIHLKLLAEIEGIALTVHYESTLDLSKAPLHTLSNTGRPHIHLLYRDREGSSKPEADQGLYQRISLLTPKHAARL